VRRLRPVLAVAVAGAVSLAVSASAASAPLVLTDAKGDANGVNGQGVADQNGQPGPGSQDGKDILGLTLTPTGGKKCTGYTAVVELAAAPTSNTHYRVLGTTAKNTSLFWLQYDNNPLAGTTSVLRYNDGSGAKVVDLSTPVKVAGSKLTFTVTAKDLKAAGEKLAGLAVLAPGVDVRTSTGRATVPSWDVLPESDKSFKPCG
jgi:hypothetical protein